MRGLPNDADVDGRKADVIDQPNIAGEKDVGGINALGAVEVVHRRAGLHSGLRRFHYPSAIGILESGVDDLYVPDLHALPDAIHRSTVRDGKADSTGD
jgi:hypothetical protein